MKSSLLFAAAALALVVVFSSESNASALHSEKINLAAPEDEAQHSPDDHVRETRDLHSCNVGGFACNLNCQFQGYEKGKCVGRTCKCFNYSG